MIWNVLKIHSFLDVLNKKTSQNHLAIIIKRFIIMRIVDKYSKIDLIIVESVEKDVRREKGEKIFRDHKINFGMDICCFCSIHDDIYSHICKYIQQE